MVFVCYPKDPAVLKIYDVLIHYRRINSLSVEISCAFPQENKVFQRPCRIIFTTVVFFPSAIVN